MRRVCILSAVRERYISILSGPQMREGKATMHYPSSLTCSTVGGLSWRTAASGAVSTKYGKIDDMVICRCRSCCRTGTSLLTSPRRPSTRRDRDLNRIIHRLGGDARRHHQGADPHLSTRRRRRRFRSISVPGYARTRLTQGVGILLQKFKPSVMRLYDEAETAIADQEGRSACRTPGRVHERGRSRALPRDGGRSRRRSCLDTYARYGAEDLGSLSTARSGGRRR